MAEIINRPERPERKLRNYDYVIPGLRRMVEYAAVKVVGPRDIPKKISEIMGYKGQNSYTMKFVDLSDQSGGQDLIGITRDNLYDFCRVLRIPFGFFYHFSIYDRTDSPLSERELIEELFRDHNADKKVESFEKLVIEFWHDLECPSGCQNLAKIAEYGTSKEGISIASPGERGVAPIQRDGAALSKTFSYGEPYLIKVQIEQPRWLCALMEFRDDPYIVPSFVMLHGPELGSTDALGELVTAGIIGEPSGRFRLLAYLFDRKLEMPEWAEICAGSECPTSLVNKMIKMLSIAPESCRLMISDAYEVYPR